MMILTVDIGNSDIVFGIWKDEAWKYQWRHPSAGFASAGEVFTDLCRSNQVDPLSFDRIILSSVVPRATGDVRAALEKITAKPIMVMSPGLYTELEMDIDNPEEIGSDLVANAVAGWDRFGQAAVVVDFGTALTFTTISGKGKILGVAIAPGIHTAMRALFLNTAQLPEIPLELPESAIGKNTTHALQAGILIGYVGLVKEVLDRTRKELGTEVKVVATGGLSSVLTPLRSCFDEIDPYLTLNGLRIISEKFSNR